MLHDAPAPPQPVPPVDSAGGQDVDAVEAQVPEYLRPGPIRRLSEAMVVAGSCLFVFWQLHPDLIVSKSTPAGGDMGAHVWAFGFLRDHLLPSGRLTGWTPDWYAGFPAFQFYMVIPFLAMVALNAGFGGVAALVPASASLLASARAAGASLRDRVILGAVGVAAGLGLFFGAWHTFNPAFRFTVIIITTTAAGVALAFGRGRHRVAWGAAAIGIGVVGVALPYGSAFKIVTVAGVVAMPAAAWTLGRLARLPAPTPPLLAVVTVAFLFDTSFSIYGGNIASTMAGEFAFSISLALALVYIGVLFHGLRTGTHRVTAAVLLALVGLCHLIPAFFAIGATAVILAVHQIAGDWRSLARIRWVAVVGVVSGLVASWWVLPFYWQRTYLNDMGWEKIAVHRPGVSYWDWFSGDVWPLLVPHDLRFFAVFALVGAILAIAFGSRAGVSLVIMGFGLAVAFVVVPQGRLWNARLLPFWYLVVYLLAAIGVAEVIRSIAQLLSIRGQSGRRMLTAAAPVAFVLLAAHFGGQLRNFPGGAERPQDGTYRLVSSVGIPGLFSVDVPDALAIDVTGRNFVTDWARWNYSGYEGKQAWPEYRGIVAAMAEIGEERGCGRSLWEYNPDLNDYGTPMALMLLPHWTDGCIGSMEGLYFEASSTTPFHFLLQSELSQQPSRAQRSMPYRPLDLDSGVDHLQLLGVRYYMAKTPEATDAAHAQADLTPIGTDGPWTIFEVADADLVEGLVNVPAVTTASEHQDEWLGCNDNGQEPCPGAALTWFQDSTAWDVALAADGPSSWPRVEPGATPEQIPVEPATVTNVRVDPDTISFDVDRTGSPVLVKSSYFPNWRADGADGPYRVAPNLMVVVPTDTRVVLQYRRHPVELVAMAFTVIGLMAAVFLARRRPEPVGSLSWEP